MSGSCRENIFHSHFSTSLNSSTNYKDRIEEKENHCQLFYQIPLHNCIPFHSSGEMLRCGENHLLKKDHPYMLVQMQLSMQDVDQLHQLMPAIRDKISLIFL